MVDHPLGREIVQREGVARAAAAIRLGRIVGLRGRRRVWQCLVRKHRATEDRALDVGPGPDLRGPIHGAAGLVQHRSEAGHMCRADRFEAELFFAAPLHADAMIRDLHRDDRGIQSRIVGAVMTIAAGAVGVPHRHLLALQAQNVGNAVAQRIDALGMRPDRQMPVAVFRQGAGWRQGRMGDEGPGIGLADDRAGFRRRAGIAEMPVVGGLVAEPRGLLLHAGSGPAPRSSLHARERRPRHVGRSVSSGPTKATKSPTRTIRISPPAALRIAASFNRLQPCIA